MPFTRKFLIIALSSLSSLLLANEAIYAQETESKPPRGKDWLEHVENDLNPWWNQPPAYGDPIGDYPSYRCDNGDVIDLDNLCYPYNSTNAENYVQDKLIVSQSRQIYTYGAAYHLTGDPQYLSLAKAGVDWLIDNAIDRDNGGTYRGILGQTGEWDTDPARRTSQQQAYAIQGLTFYYYLTQDPTILKEIKPLHDYIVDNYYDLDAGVVNFLPTGSENQRQLIQAPLDQLNSYLLLLTSVAPENLQNKYSQDLVEISEILIDNFYSPEYNIFWGSLDEPEDQTLSPGNTDYGNSIKAMWMIYLVGNLTDNSELIEFAQTNIPPLLEQAYDQESGTWTHSPYLDEDGDIVNDLAKSWWMYAVLNQTAGTLSLEDDSLIDTYLTSTVNWWFENMVDKENYGVWNTLTYPELEPIKQKQYPWKNGYHSYEHALVGYITSQATNDKPVELYFARRHQDLDQELQPYYFDGEIMGVKVSPMPSIESEDFPPVNRYKQVRVRFDDISVFQMDQEFSTFDEEMIVPEPISIMGTAIVFITIPMMQKVYRKD